MNLDDLALQWRDMEPHTATLCRLARDARTILELGVRGGVSTWALLDGLPPDGRMASIDIEDVCEGLPERLTADSRWRFIHGDDRLVAWPDADLVFIDTSHEYHHTLDELRMAERAGAHRIALHDWNLPDVEDAVWRFLRGGRYRLWMIEPSEWGLAVLAR